MAIKITENGVVRYENEPNVDRLLFPNTSDCGRCSEQIDELSEQIDELKENLTDLQELADTKAAAICETASGAIASFSDGADDMPLKSCVVSIEPIQEGSGDPSPENVRPISGRTGLTVSHSGADTSDSTTISVNWETEAGTVYGGYVDVVSGKLTVDSEYITPTAPIINSNSTWASGRYSINLSTYGYPLDHGVDADPVGLYCDKLRPIRRKAVINSTPYTIAYDIGTAKLQFFLNSDISTLGMARTWITNNPIQIVYRLKEPFEIQLTPQEIRTLLGANNIWSDGGDMEVEYPADTKMYIEKLTVPTGADMIADHVISANSFFMIGNTLYRATTDIASGATITVGTNAIKLSLSDALNALA